MTLLHSIIEGMCSPFSPMKSRRGWVATMAIEQVADGKTNTQTFTWDWSHPLATRDAAIAGAKQQAIKWVDSQFFAAGE